MFTSEVTNEYSMDLDLEHVIHKLFNYRHGQHHRGAGKHSAFQNIKFAASIKHPKAKSVSALGPLPADLGLYPWTLLHLLVQHYN